MNEKFVYAVYESIEEAKQAVNRLTLSGIPLNAITLYADDDVIEGIHKGELLVELKELDDEHDQRSIWNRITDFFSMNDHGEEFSVNFSDYQDDIDHDKILVVLDKTYEGEALAADSPVADMDVADPNQVETFVHEEPSTEPVVNDQAELEDVKDDKVVETAKPAEDKYVPGDLSRESEVAEAYYTNIESHKVVKKKNEPHPYVKDPASDEELLRKNEENSIAGDMGSYSDYSEYYQETPNKSPDKETQHELGEFEEEMRRHESNPPADEFGVNPEQFEDQ